VPPAGGGRLLLTADDPYERQLLVEHLRHAAADGAALHIAGIGRWRGVVLHCRSQGTCTRCGAPGAMLHWVERRADWCVPCGLAVAVPQFAHGVWYAIVALDRCDRARP